jgi:hypothetical protein
MCLKIRCNGESNKFCNGPRIFTAEFTRKACVSTQHMSSSCRRTPATCSTAPYGVWLDGGVSDQSFPLPPVTSHALSSPRAVSYAIAYTVRTSLPSAQCRQKAPAGGAPVPSPCRAAVVAVGSRTGLGRICLF